MAKLRHIAITVPDPEKAAAFYMRAFGMERVGETDWANARGVYLTDGTINLALLHYKTEEAAGGKHWMGEPTGGTGFYEVKFHDPDGIAFDVTANGWAGALKD
jgi:catechol 2,3-dioxygenase-like lactoylglutathione lyase family enzyme